MALVAERFEALVRSRLNDVDQRYTAGRRALVAVLASTDRPLTAAEIIVTGGLPQSSAYRNLTVLEECGVVHRILSVDGFARYELAHDLTDHHHHHLICTACGDVSDFTVPDPLERAIEEMRATVATQTGFAPNEHRLDLLGLCGGCG